MLKKTGKKMDKARIGFTLVMLFLILPSAAFSFTATAQVDKTSISIQDAVYLKITVEGAKAELDMSAVKDFKVHSRGKSSSFQFINGNTSRQIIFQYVLLPLSKGKLEIPSIRASADGMETFTEPITISVSDHIVKTDGTKALFAKSSITDPELFAGQQTVFSIKFFTSRQLGGLAFETQPDFKGLSAKAFDKEKNYTLNINGRAYNVTEVSYLIIPSEAGDFTIDPAVFIAKVLVKGQDPMFDPFFSSSRHKAVRIVSNPVTVKVRELPQYKGNIPFSGLVGDFTIEGALDKNQLRAGESATFTIQIAGTGNVMDAGLPEINLKSLGFKVYDDNPVEKLSLTQDGYKGSKIFKKALVPVRPGQYTIQPIPLVYFNVDGKEYKTISTHEIELGVLEGEALPDLTTVQSAPKTARTVQEEVALENRDILDIKQGLNVLEDYKPMDGRAFLCFLCLPGVLFFIFKFFFQISNKDLPVEKIMRDRAKDHLHRAVKAGIGNKTFLGHLYSALMAAVLARGKRQAESVTMDEAKTILEATSVDNDQIEKIVKTFKILEAVRFGGEKIDENRASELMAVVKQAVKTICLVIICSGMFFISAQKTQANVTTDFTDGIKHYKAGQFTAAAESWKAIAEKSVRNPYLYYNLGNAYLKAGDTGRAILWYERAKLLSPGNPDLNFNLSHARTLVKDKKQEGIRIIDILFFWDSFIGERIIQIISICMSVVFFSWAGVRVRKQAGIFSGKGILLFAAFVFVSLIALVNYYKHSLRQEAVIVAQEVAVRSGTAREATILFTLHAGTLVNIEQIQDNNLKILFSKDMVGWIEQDEAILVRPQDTK